MTDETRLPDGYDELVSKERLHHDRHNVREVAPSDRLRRSIEKDGIQAPLVVRTVADKHSYGVVDGWQRYQAATELGWDEFPVKIYEDTLAALEAAEIRSINRGWTTYQAARHIRSLYTELADGTERLNSVAVRQAAEWTACAPSTVRKYLRAFSLPSELHPLLKERQNVTEAEWLALENYHSDIRRYDGVPWKVAGELGKHTDTVPEQRQRRLLLAAVGYDTEAGLQLIREGVRDPSASIDLLQQRLEGNGQYDSWLRVPQTGIDLDPERKAAVLDYCHRRKIHLSDVVADQMRAFADRVVDEEADSGSQNS